MSILTKEQQVQSKAEEKEVLEAVYSGFTEMYTGKFNFSYKQFETYGNSNVYLFKLPAFFLKNLVEVFPRHAVTALIGRHYTDEEYEAGYYIKSLEEVYEENEELFVLLEGGGNTQEKTLEDFVYDFIVSTDETLRDELDLYIYENLPHLFKGRINNFCDYPIIEGPMENILQLVIGLKENGSKKELFKVHSILDLGNSLKWFLEDSGIEYTRKGNFYQFEEDDSEEFELIIKDLAQFHSRNEYNPMILVRL